MTLFTIDIAFYQAGLSVAEVQREGFAALMARASTGYGTTQLGLLARSLSGHHDPGIRRAAAAHVVGDHQPLRSSIDTQFSAFRKQARAAGMLFGAYHFLYPSRSVSIANQATTCAAAIGDTTIPVMIDHEPDGSGAPIPTVADAVAFAQAMRAKGYRVPLWYLPHWVWNSMGSPALPTNQGLVLVASSYVTGSGTAAALYPGAGSWPASYGGLRPALWQFTSSARVAGQNVDANAFEGTAAALAALFGGDTDMPIKDDPDAWAEALRMRALCLGATTSWSGSNKDVPAIWPNQALQQILANQAAESAALKAAQAAITSLTQVVQAGGGNVDAAPILAAISEASRSESATVQALQAEVADLKARLLAGAQAEADALKPSAG